MYVCYVCGCGDLCDVTDVKNRNLCCQREIESDIEKRERERDIERDIERDRET